MVTPTLVNAEHFEIEGEDTARDQVGDAERAERENASEIQTEASGDEEQNARDKGQGTGD
jgi:hypothetical protein